MTRVLMIDGDSALTEAVGMQCLERGIAIRMAPSLCEGARQLLETPVSLILVSAGLVHVSGAELTRVLDAAAPGVPVLIRVDTAQGVDEQVRFELDGFRVVREPFDILDLVAKAERPARVIAPRASAARAAVEALCG